MNRRLLIVGFEATDGELVRRWVAEGHLPTMARIAERGSLRPIESAGEVIQEATFASALSGCRAGRHGAYGWRVLAPGTLTRIRLDDGTWCKPFWEVAGDLAPEHDILLLDTPYGAVGRGERRTEVRGWGMRISRRPISNPAGLYAELAARHRPHPAWLNREYKRSPRAQRRYLRTLLELTERRGDLALELLGRRPWDCALITFSEPHFGGHAFYHHLRPGAPGFDPAQAAELGDSLLRSYQAADEQLGRLIAAVGADTDVVVFSAMGLRVNECSRDLPHEILIRLGLQVPKHPSGRSGLFKTGLRVGRAALPRFVRHRIAGLLPAREIETVADATWSDSIDWGRSRAVAESEPGESWIRVNLRGREPRGIVAPSDLEATLEEISEEVLSLTHPETGEPAAVAVERAAQVAPGPRSDHFPDLLIRWRREVPLRGVVHPRLGLIRDSGRPPRTEHSRNGFLAAAGPSFATAEGGAELAATSECDIAAIALQLLGSPLPDDLEGNVPPGLLAGTPEITRVAYELATRPGRLP